MDIHADGDSSDSPDIDSDIFLAGSDRKPIDMWMAEDGLSILCPFCDREHQSDDKLGRHLVHDHWREIDFATKHLRDMNAQSSVR
jgi:hypothetical protein